MPNPATTAAKSVRQESCDTPQATTSAATPLSATFPEVSAICRRVAHPIPATCDNGATYETPSATSVRLHSLKELARAVIARQSLPTIARPVAHAYDAAALSNYREALLLGRLVICANCARFVPRSDTAGLGHCQRFDTDAWPFAPFWCSGFKPSNRPVAPDFLPDPDGARACAKEYAT